MLSRGGGSVVVELTGAPLRISEATDIAGGRQAASERSRCNPHPTARDTASPV